MVWCLPVTLHAKSSSAKFILPEDTEENLERLQQPTDSLSRIASSVAKDNIIVFSAASKGFLPSVTNWLAFMYRLQVYNILLLAMDLESFKFFSDRGLAVYLCEPFETTQYLDQKNKKFFFQRMQVWVERVRVISHLLTLGYSVVSSDSDALWLRNPLPELVSLSTTNDIVFSRGNAASGPKSVSHGVGVCMGFVFYTPQVSTKKFIKEILQYMRLKSVPDQPAVNRLIWGDKAVNRDTNPYNTELWTKAYNGLKFSLLPQTRYARHIGKGLNDIDPDLVNIHVFHGTDEGWNFSMRILPEILPRDVYERVSGLSYDPQRNLAYSCKPPHWFERPIFSNRDISVLKCAGLWLLKDSWKDLPDTWKDKTFKEWITIVSEITLVPGP